MIGFIVHNKAWEDPKSVQALSGDDPMHIVTHLWLISLVMTPYALVLFSKWTTLLN